MTKRQFKYIATRVVVTFFEGAGAVLSVNSWDFTNKTVLGGAAAAGLSAVYNLWVHYKS